MKNLVASMVVVLLSVCTQKIVRADDSIATPAAADTYRLQMLGADALSVGLVFGSAYGGSGMLLGGLAVGAFGAPVVHFANGHTTRGLLSMGVRLVAPFLGMVVAAKVGGDCDFGLDNDNGGNSCLVGVGWFAGYAAGLVTDYVFIASLDDKPTIVAKPTPSVSMAVLPKSGGALLSAVGSF